MKIVTFLLGEKTNNLPRKYKKHLHHNHHHHRIESNYILWRPLQNGQMKDRKSVSKPKKKNDSLDTHTLTIMAKSCFSDLFPICSISLVYFWKKCVRVSRMLEKMGENMKYNAMAMLSSEMNVGKSIFFTHTQRKIRLYSDVIEWDERIFSAPRE